LVVRAAAGPRRRPCARGPPRAGLGGAPRRHVPGAFPRPPAGGGPRRGDLACVRRRARCDPLSRAHAASSSADRAMNATPVDPISGVVYPVGLRLLGKRVVVVGGGQVAHRRVAGLLEARALVTVVSPEVTPALEALVEPGAVTWLRRRYETGDLDGAWYAVAATDDP